MVLQIVGVKAAVGFVGTGGGPHSGISPATCRVTGSLEAAFMSFFVTRNSVLIIDFD